MLIAFQFILLIMILIGFMGMIGEKEDLNLRNNLTGICIVSIISFVVLIIV